MSHVKRCPYPESASPRVARAALAALAALAVGCAVEAQEAVGVAAQEALNPNALNPNALNPNALNPNALNPNALNPNALNPNALSPDAMGAIRDPGSAGDLSRELLRYTVSCAFRPDQSFKFSWTDASGVKHKEAYTGLLSLAPSWEAQPLDPAGQEWVSDCLASRVNAEGVSVMLSSRGAHPALTCSPVELATYSTREAAFFGNLFTGEPKVHACYDPLSMLPAQMARRVCSQPDLLRLDLNALPGTYACGPIEVLGPCAEVLGLITVGPCATEDPVERYLHDCAPASGAPVVRSITTFLHGVVPW
jgi:hypothetical protein